MSRSDAFIEWYLRLYRVDSEAVDSESAIAAREAELGARLPELLRAVYARTSMRESQMLHLEPLNELRIVGGALVFARDQQDSWVWGIPLTRLGEENPRLVSDPHGDFADDEFTLDAWLRYYAVANRPYEPPMLDQPGVDESRLDAEPWQRFGVEGVCLLTGFWVADGAAWDGVNLGARDVDALRRAARSLDVDDEAFDDLLVDAE